jgi:hypothetical protein
MHATKLESNRLSFGLTSTDTVLDMSSQNIHCLQVFLFKLTPKVEVVNLRNNRYISSIHGSFFNNLGNLRSVDFYGNQLVSLPAFFITYHPSIRSVELGRNLFTTFTDTTAFTNNPNLEYVGLDANYLTSLADSVFTGLTNLKTLSVQFNKMVQTVSQSTYLSGTVGQGTTIKYGENLIYKKNVI